MDFAVFNKSLSLFKFSVDDPPHAMDPNLVDVAEYLSVHLGNDADFYKF